MSEDKYLQIKRYVAGAILQAKDELLAKFIAEMFSDKHIHKTRLSTNHLKEYAPFLIIELATFLQLDNSELPELFTHAQEHGRHRFQQGFINLDLGGEIRVLKDTLNSFVDKLLQDECNGDEEIDSSLKNLVDDYLNKINRDALMECGKQFLENNQRVMQQLIENCYIDEQSKLDLKVETIITSSIFAEAGHPIGIYWSNDRSLFAIAGYFGHSQWGGRDISVRGYLNSRVCLYNAADLSLRAIFDQIDYHVHDIAFHPDNNHLIIGTGSYDGGWSFGGDLWLWNFNTDEKVPLFMEPAQFSKCQFDLDATKLTVVIFSEHHQEDLENESYTDEFVIEELDIAIDKLILAEQSLSFREFELTEIYRSEKYPISYEHYQSPIPAIKALAKNHGAYYELRCNIHDLYWSLDTDLLAGTICGFERWREHNPVSSLNNDSNNGWQRILYLTDEEESTQHGHGQQCVQIVSTANSNRVIVNFSRGAASKETHLEEIDLDSGLKTILSDFDHQVVLSKDNRSNVLARDCQHKFEIDDPKADQARIIYADSKISSSFFVGGYNLFADYFRIDNAPDLYILQSTPPDSHYNKWICRVDKDILTVQRLFPLVDASLHTFELASDGGLFIKDELGESLILAAKCDFRYAEFESMRSIVMRRHLPDGKIGWAALLEGQITAMTLLSNLNCLVVATVKGYLSVINSKNGYILYTEKFLINDISNIIISLAAKGDRVAAGTIDGRIIIYQIQHN